jgi:hypothetical protein
MSDERFLTVEEASDLNHMNHVMQIKVPTSDSLKDPNAPTA